DRQYDDPWADRQGPCRHRTNGAPRALSARRHRRDPDAGRSHRLQHGVRGKGFRRARIVVGRYRYEISDADAGLRTAGAGDRTQPDRAARFSPPDRYVAADEPVAGGDGLSKVGETNGGRRHAMLPRILTTIIVSLALSG